MGSESNPPASCEITGIVIDRDYRYQTANRAFLNYRGMKRGEVIGRRVNEILNPGVFESALKEKIDECFRGRTVQFEMSYRYANRGDRELLIGYFPIAGRNGIDRIACVLQDVTDRKESHRSLKLFRTLIDHSNDGVQVVDPETLYFIDVNEKACDDLGYTRPELLAMKVCDIVPAADRSSCEAVLHEQAIGFGNFAVSAQGCYQNDDDSDEATCRIHFGERVPATPAQMKSACVSGLM